MINRITDNKFKLVSKYQPSGDQPQAIEQLVDNIEGGEKAQILMGATGTGKTYTMSQVISKVNKPTLVIAHNKTLAGQLYGEFKEFSLKMQLSTSYPTMTITSQKPMSLLVIPILRRIVLSMTRLTSFVTQRLQPYWSAMMLLSWPRSLVSMVWVRPRNTLIVSLVSVQVLKFPVINS